MAKHIVVSWENVPGRWAHWLVIEMWPLPVPDSPSALRERGGPTRTAQVPLGLHGAGMGRYEAVCAGAYWPGPGVVGGERKRHAGLLDYIEEATHIRASRALARTAQVDQACAVVDWVWLIQRALNYPGGEEGGKGGKGEVWSRVFCKIWKTCSAILVPGQAAGRDL